ncbi:MAG: hydrogenase nickel incorporation protein HypB [Spirochaetes bacterium]|nr:hydrogenase nickel incorporation protein HypB [Spirochaetota bacterium]
MEVKVYANVMKANDRIADQIRTLLDKYNIFAINFISSPGSGKTTLLESLIPHFISQNIRPAVLEGDLATSVDAERIKKLDIPVHQINTGSGCHLDANMIFHPIQDLPLDTIDLLLIENVGNLVCPTGFYLGENMKIAMVSVTEGDDKVLKYPLIFHVSEALILNKIDLIPYTNFNKDKFYQYCAQVNPKVKIFEINAVKGDGVNALVEWILERMKRTEPMRN